MATIEQLPLARAIACPYNACDSAVIEKVSGTSECAYTDPVDSNHVSIVYVCRKCNKHFVLHYHFESIEIPITEDE
jgi:hypothetical protein